VIVIALKPGQLGNQLWLFSHFIAFSRETGVAVLNPAFSEYAHYFPATRRQRIPHYPTSGGTGRPLSSLVYPAMRTLGGLAARLDGTGRLVPTVRIGFPRGFDLADTFSLRDPEFSRVARRRRIVVVKGWQFTNGASLVAHRAALREFFAPSERVLDRSRQHVATVRPDEGVVVGVHVRRGDARQFLGGRYDFDLDVYRRIMDEASAALAPLPVKFLICSDEKLACADFDVRVSFGLGDVLGDLYTLARCDYLIGPPSTYSMWASFYGAVPIYTISRADQECALAGFQIRESQFPLEPHADA
jgi:hypothetical protein